MAFDGLADNVFMSEIEPFPRAVLKHRFPNHMLHGDFTNLVIEPVPADILCGGTPCTSFSLAGKRLSLDDARGNLALLYALLLDSIDYMNKELGEQPCVCLWENVPGVLSVKDNAFGCFLAAMVGFNEPLVNPTSKRRWPSAGLVSGPSRRAAWRVLDAQYFGLPQRRKRVFVVISAREGFDPAKVLFECDSVSGYIAPSRQKKKDVTGTLASRTRSGGGLGTDFDLDGGLVAASYALTDLADYTANERFDFDTDTFIVQNPVAFGWQNSSHQGDSVSESVTPTLDKSKIPAVCHKQGVRRLTPVEAERLQGFPDGHTWIPEQDRRKIESDYLNYLRQYFPDMPLVEAERLSKDGPRYKAIGNAFAVPVVRWIANRIVAEIRWGEAA